jgi:hypothetical protein
MVKGYGSQAACNKTGLQGRNAPHWPSSIRFTTDGERVRFVYFSLLFATAYWFLVSLVRLIIAKRNVNVIVESPERNANVNALERAWTAENPKVEEED